MPTYCLFPLCTYIYFFIVFQTMFASSDGEIDLRCETDTVAITTHFKDLNLTSGLNT